MTYASIATPMFWALFCIFILLMLALDLGVFHRKAHKVSFNEALAWSLVWMALALCFNVLIWSKFGPEKGVEFLTGYLIEKSLSIDNIFVFVIIFTAFKIPATYQHRVLFWGIISALAMRAAMIFAGAALLEKFHFLIYFFGGLLILTGIKLFIQRNKNEHPEKSWSFRITKKIIPATAELHGSRFFIRQSGKWIGTPLFLALVLVEITDVIFAIDSIPAIFSVTKDPFIVFTSNIFAILGMRSLYFLLSGMMEKFRYLKVGLSGILIFVGFKMCVVDIVKVDPFISLGIILTILSGSLGASWWVARDFQTKKITVRV